IGAHVGPFVRREPTALGAVDAARGDTLFVDVERACTALADAATVIGKLVADGRLSCRQRLLGSNCIPLQTQPVVGISRLAIFQVEAPATKAARLREDHAIGPAPWNFHV